MDSAKVNANRVRFNDCLIEAIEETVSAILSRKVLESFYAHLAKHHTITRDEIPYRLDTVFSELEIVFGGGAKTLGKAIAKRFYLKLGIKFHNLPNAVLIEYVEAAKQKIT